MFLKLTLLVTLTSLVLLPAVAQDKISNPEDSKAISKKQQLPTQGELRTQNNNRLRVLNGEKVPSQSDSAKTTKSIKEILSQRKYNDSGVLQKRNWFASSANRIQEALKKFFDGLFNRNAPEINVSPVAPGALSVAIWILFGLALISFFIWAILQIGKRSQRLRRTTNAGLFDENEPARTADEWLVKSDELAALGKYREAVRCLYIASLVRFDEANVARLIRHETNWEHLRRIETSARLPFGIDFRTATQMFDSIWYGFKSNGISDVDDFRRIYLDICQKLNITTAA